MGCERSGGRWSGGLLHALVAPLLAAVAGWSGPGLVRAAEVATAGDPSRFLARYCGDCHRGDQPEGGVELVLPADDAALRHQRRLWEAAVRRIEAGEMPPSDHPQPDLEAADAFARAVRSRYEKADLLAPPSPGRVTMRRLNRMEYRNTIRDLVGVDFDPTEDFPSDDIGHGFDTIGDVLTVSPLLLDRYLDAAEAVMERAIPVPTPAVIRRWRPAMFTEPASADVPKLIVEGFRRMTTDSREAIQLGPINVPFEWEDDGEYEFRTRVYSAPDAPSPVRVAVLVSGGGIQSPSSDAELDRFSGSVPRPAKILQSFPVTGTCRQSNALLTIRIPPMPGRERMLLAVERPVAGSPPVTVFLDGMALDGPLDPRPASHRRLLDCAGAPQREQTREVLGRFLRRAFRRRLEDGELERHAGLVDRAVNDGRTWPEAVRLAMQAAICSPKFLFRMECDDRPDDPGVGRLDDFQVASRLSYFLWGTMPDDELLDAAERGGLSAGLGPHVRRMLADVRAESLVSGFAMQWLQLKRIESIAPDGGLFPSFDNTLRSAMVREVELFVGRIFREDRSILELIDADYTFVNGVLARHYGLEEAYRQAGGAGTDFRAVAVGNRPRGGLVSQAGILTATSNPTRTSPVKRGRWVLEQLLGEPPPPPPPNVPELPESATISATLPLRQRMEAHRRNAACASCHARMDAIGFALENYDAVGAFRESDGAFDIDAAGTFPDGTAFRGPAGLKDMLLSRRRHFSRCLTEKMLTYALGRGVEPADRPTVERIVDQLEAGNHRFSLLVAGIVASDAFRQRAGRQTVD